MPWWAWPLGLGILAVAAVIVLRRRGRGGDAGAERAFVEEPAPPPAPIPAAPSPPGPVATPAAAPRTPPAAVPGETPHGGESGLSIAFRPRRLTTRGPDALVDFELLIANTDTAVAEGIRVALVLTSAGPDSAAEIAAFHARAANAATPEPFSLNPGQSIALEGELTLPGSAMIVTDVGDRSMIVPLALVNIRWRGGLAIRQMGEALVFGVGDAGSAKLSPIWVDRPGASYERLTARRFHSRD